MAVVSELTEGQLDAFFSYSYTFHIRLTEDALVVYVPFRRIEIPISSIDRLSSVKVHRFGKSIRCLRVYHYCEGAPRRILFGSTKWDAWFSAFEEKGIPTQDVHSLREDAGTIWFVSKVLNVGVGLPLLVFTLAQIVRNAIA